MYAAGYLQPIGIWLMTNNWLLTLLWILQKAFVTARIRREDLLMVELFQEEYHQYHKQTGALCPWKPFGWDLGLSNQEVDHIICSSKKVN
jgi:protein-S-isoprenylcysteine O-methyltransferase Ste14